MRKKQKKIIYNPKKHVKLSELAKSLSLDYRSCFLKQRRLGILSIRVVDKDREVICFTNKNADLIRASTAPFITPAQTELTKIEKKCKIDRPKMLRVLAKLGIRPEKRRRHEANPRSVLTVKVNTIPKIKRVAENLF